MPLPRSATVGTPARAEETERRDLVEHKFMEMDEEHTRIRDRFLSSPPHPFE